MLPMASAGLFNFVAGPTLNATPTRPHGLLDTVSRVPAVLFWVWLNLLVASVGR